MSDALYGDIRPVLLPMPNENIFMIDTIDLERRRLLTNLTALTAAVGTGFAAAPFVSSWKPSARARAIGAPVDVDISKLEPGAMMTVEWRGKPVWIVRRTPAMLEQVAAAHHFLSDPESSKSLQPAYATNASRSVNPEYLVLVGVCTHLGCTPMAKFTGGDQTMSADWPGGFYCPCHGSKFDLSGRVFKNVPAPTNLTVPPYEFVGPGRILVGRDASQTA